ncbi:MAG: hypothetical protein N4J56_000677 [Chroococcidiopsis sp. SAG 2025]|uniref:DUF3086 domain-containing protein n=1 Tax=Chroococcidiopsis sp. SAG 2025 TaxID=171389 RepID=UPI0029371931|nr:DUF3086 domain-containing protein [Chroococcidiopsis sp. SAG 2025]MDV2991023.1 hypothetical protein [Chroococcidiopsis sp. SAG 2025]
MTSDESQTPKPDNQPWEDSEEQDKPLNFSMDAPNGKLEEINLLDESRSESNTDKDTDTDLDLENFNFFASPSEEAEDEFLQELVTPNSARETPAETPLIPLAKPSNLSQLQQQEQALRQEIARLQATHKQLSAQLAQTQSAMSKVVQEGLAQMEQRKQALQISIEQLERRQERIRAEMRTSFAGVSQDLAIRVQGFKDYLTGSLQDLATAVEQLELAPKTRPEPQPATRQPKPQEPEQPATPQFTEQRFQATTKQIRRLLDQYRNQPDYYGPPWQLRRTFEPVQAERVSNWFFKQGGRGALRTTGSRLQNILISSAIISILYTLYDTRLRILVLANTPERLGDWRRGLQDCLGISRTDFGPDRGVTLFEDAEAAAIRAERAIEANQMPLIIIDDSEEKISLSLLQFPLLLAFAPDPQTLRERDFDY